MRPPALILALCACTLAVAIPPAPPGQPDDMEGILGNESCSWDASDGATYYELRRSDETEPCLTVTEPSALVAGTACVEPDTTAYLHVRACNDVGCSEWSTETVAFDPWACFTEPGSECETLCYDGAFLRLEERWPACP